MCVPVKNVIKTIVSNLIVQFAQETLTMRRPKRRSSVSIDMLMILPEIMIYPLYLAGGIYIITQRLAPKKQRYNPYAIRF